MKFRDSPRVNITRLDNVLDRLLKRMNINKNKHAEYNKNIEDAKAEFEKPF